mgnify:FL=1
MKKKIMLPVDDSTRSKQAVDYAVRLSALVRELHYVLFHVQPGISGFLADEAKTDFKARQQMEKVMEKNAKEAVALMDQFKTRMVKGGISEDRIELVTQPKNMGIAKDIMDWAQQHIYDAVVVGRRGLSGVQKSIMGSLTSKLAAHAMVCPLWVIDGTPASDKILLAVDGSESSLKAVDHLSFMFEGNKEVKITLFHVTLKLSDYCEINFEDKGTDLEEIVTQGARRCVDRFFAHAQEKFKQAGIDEDQVEIKVSKRAIQGGKAIIDEAKNGGYGTVVVGRRGTGKAFFIGSVSKYVLDRASDLALWLVS